MEKVDSEGTKTLLTASAKDIRAALSESYQQPDWYLGFEVGNGTGATATRHADAIAICQYPSRGYEVRGFEIKISRNDLKHELETPAKAEAFNKYCNLWYLVVPKGLTKDMQVPENWGVIEYDNGKLRQKKRAQYTENKIDWGFLVAFLRGNEREKREEYKEWEEKARTNIRKYLLDENQDYKYKYEYIEKKIRFLERKTGFSLEKEYGWDRMPFNEEKPDNRTQRNLSALKAAVRLRDTENIPHNLQYQKRQFEYLKDDFSKMCTKITEIYSSLENIVDDTEITKRSKK